MSSRVTHRQLFAGRPVSGPLALDLSPDAVTLMARRPGDGWSPVAEAPLDDPDFSTRIDELRVEAVVRDASRAPVALWLPGDQVLVRQYVLTRTGDAAYAEAMRRISAETGYEPAELMLALSAPDAGAPTTVLAALTQTVQEARDYARRWGFEPGAVSTRIEAEAFLPGFAIFTSPPSPARRAGRAVFRAAAMAACVAALAIGAYGMFRVAEPLFDATDPDSAAEPLFAMVDTLDDRPYAAPVPLDAVRFGRTQGLPIQRLRVSDAQRMAALGAIRHGPRPRGASPEILEAPRSEAPMRIGPTPARPERTRPGRLAAASGSPGRNIAQPVRQALDRIRLEGRRLAAATRTDTDSRQTTAEAPRSIEAPQGSLVLASLPRETTPDTQDPDPAPVTGDQASLSPQSQTPAPDPAPEAEGAAELPGEQLSSLAPVEMTDQPRPRPANVQPDPEPVAEPQAQPAPAPVEAPAPSAVTQTATAAPEAQTPQPDTAQTEPETDPDAPTVYAALNAPKPRVRPAQLARAAAATRQSSGGAALRRTAPASRSVRTAASESGLALNKTSLIGVIDARSGRQALVRMPSGDYRKVGRGDTLDGWRVSSIGREAMKLTRRGQSRTLLLVSR